MTLSLLAAAMRTSSLQQLQPHPRTSAPTNQPAPPTCAGTDIYLNAFFIPLGVVIYTAHGGLRGTYIASWAHVAVIYIALCIFMFLIYGALRPAASCTSPWPGSLAAWQPGSQAAWPHSHTATPATPSTASHREPFLP